MAFKVADCDNVRETFTGAGSTTITLGGAAPNSRSLSSVLSSGDTFWGGARGGAEISVGLFTYTSGSPGTVAQTSVFYSSNSNSAVSFSNGNPCEIFIDLPSRVSEPLKYVTYSGGVISVATAANFSGGIAGFAGTNTFGPGGTGVSPAYVSIDGGSGTAGGSAVLFKSNSTNRGAVGTHSSILGTGTSNDVILYQYGGGGIGLRVTDATGVVTIPNSTASTTTTTGALVVTGGVGIGGNISTGGNITINNGGGPTVFFQISGTTQSSILDNSLSINVNSNAAQTAGMYILHGANAWSTISDARLSYKRTARDISDNLPSLDGFRLYESEVNGVLQVFPKAQEVHALFPHVVTKGDDDPDYVPTGLSDPRAWGMSYDRLGAIALAYARQHATRLDALEARQST